MASCLMVAECRSGEICRTMPRASKVFAGGFSATDTGFSGLQPAAASNVSAKKKLWCFITSLSQTGDFRDDGIRRLPPQAVEISLHVALRVHHGDAVGVRKISRHVGERIIQILVQKAGGDEVIHRRLVAGERSEE